jgi:hypothetical protein
MLLYSITGKITGTYYSLWESPHKMCLYGDFLNVYGGGENPEVVGAALLAVGSRRLRDQRERCVELLDSDNNVVRLNSAIALLNMKSSKEEKITSGKFSRGSYRMRSTQTFGV